MTAGEKCACGEVTVSPGAVAVLGRTGDQHAAKGCRVTVRRGVRRRASGGADSPSPPATAGLHRAALGVLGAFGHILDAPMAAGPERDASLSRLADAVARFELES